MFRFCCLGEATLLTFLAQPPGAQAAGSYCSALKSVKGTVSSMGGLSRYSPALRSGVRASLADAIVVAMRCIGERRKSRFANRSAKHLGLSPWRLCEGKCVSWKGVVSAGEYR